MELAVGAARQPSVRQLRSVSVMPVTAQRRSKATPQWSYTHHCQLVELVRLLDVDHQSRIGDLRVRVSAARRGTRARWCAPSAVRFRGELGQRGRGRWGGPHARETCIFG